MGESRKANECQHDERRREPNSGAIRETELEAGAPHIGEH
jgi:hypothetical protein